MIPAPQKIGWRWETRTNRPETFLEARQAFETAVADYPDSGEVHWRYGSFLLRQGDLQQAYAEIHRALLSTPTLSTLAISRVWRVTQDPQVLLNEVLPENDRVMSDALTWLIDAQQPQAALPVWNQMVRIGHPVPLKVSAPLVDLLVSKEQGDEARNVWRQALALSGTDASGFTASSLVFNGGFETDALNDGLDWHWNPAPGITYAYDTSHPHSGTPCAQRHFRRLTKPQLPRCIAIRSGRTQYSVSLFGRASNRRNYHRQWR